jgi:hypothetical protein
LWGDRLPLNLAVRPQPQASHCWELNRTINPTSVDSMLKNMSEREILKVTFCTFLISSVIASIFMIFMILRSWCSLNPTVKPEDNVEFSIHEKKIDLIEKLILLLGGGTTILGGLREIQLNRSKSSHEFLVNSILEKAIKIRDELPHDIYDNPCSEDLITNDLQGLKKKVISFLNYLDYMCIAIDKGIIEEELVKSSAQYLIIKSWNHFKPAIVKFRNDKEAEHAWEGIEKKAEAWGRNDTTQGLTSRCTGTP